MRIAVKSGSTMAKTIFGTTEKSNFILNMEIDWYRESCGKILRIMLWAVALSQAINQMTYAVNAKFSDMIAAGGFGAVIALVLVMLRSVASIFAIAGVFALIWLVIGLMRKQMTKKSAVPCLILCASLAWAAVSLFHSYDLNVSFFGQDGRDEGWLALLIYAAVLYLGTMLRGEKEQERFLRGVLYFGIVQGVWGVLQAVFGFASQYVMIEPMLWQNAKLPSGMTDSPVTYAMLLGMLTAVAVPAALLCKEKKTRIAALICAALSVIMSFKTQTIAGLIAGIGGVLLAVEMFFMLRKKAAGKALAMPVTVCAAAVLAFAWTWFSPAINGTFRTSDNTSVGNGYHLCDGGIVWDDGYYRLSTAGPYSHAANEALDVYDAGSIRDFCAEQGLRALKIDPLLGVGPDNFIFTQLRVSMSPMENANALDRPYNDYLYLAATRGIPSLVLHFALLAVCAVYAKKHRKERSLWVTAASAGAVLFYVLTAWWGVSVLTVAPLFWMLLGMLAAEPLPQAMTKT